MQPTPPPAVAQVEVSRSDWQYRVGDTAVFTVRVVRAGTPVAGMPVIVQYGAERMRPMRTDTVIARREGITLRAALPVPGFLRFTARPIDGAADALAMVTVAFSADALVAHSDAPADFDAFWRDAVADARRIPLDPQMTPRPDLSSPDVAVYHVSFQNHRAGSRLYGMLAMPTRPGKYPAVLSVPGAGVRPYFPDTGTARRGVVRLTIGIHGVPVDRDSLLYNELRATALARYFTFGYDNRDTYYYKRVFVGVVRAGDFLMSLPQVDTSRYAIEGGSQGGALTLVGAALDPRVKAMAVAHPAMADQLGYRAARAGGWPHLFEDTTKLTVMPQVIRTIGYYDAVHFAKRVRVPGYFTWGFNDLTTPPTSMHALYNQVVAPKTLTIVKEVGHVRTPEQARSMREWLLRQLRVVP